MYTSTDELMLHAQRAFDLCREQVYNYEDCRQLSSYGAVNPKLCSGETLDLMRCYEKAEETEPICMHAFRKYKECTFQYSGNLVLCEHTMNEFNACQEKPQWYADNIYAKSASKPIAYSSIWKRPIILSQIIQNNLDLFDAERQKLSLKRISKPRNIHKNLDIFRLSDQSNSSSTQVQPFSRKYHEIWKRARTKVKEKLAKRHFKELELYESFKIQNFEERIKRLHSIKNDLIGTSAEILIKPSFIIHPKSRFAKSWNFFMIFILLYTGTVMPYRMAFIDGEVLDIWWILDTLLNVIFFIDLVFTCFTAFYDDSNKVVFSLHKIFLRYLKGWLLIDIFACFPLDLILEGKGENYNNLLRLFRLPRLYRLCKLSKVMKFIRSKQSSGNIFESLNLKESHLKFMGFFFTVIICSHVMSCLFYFAAKYYDFSKNTWVFKYGYLDESAFNKYIASMYWTYTTLSTVGYGDITPCSNLEIILALLWMVFGICFFSFTIGSLASMLSGVDTK